METTRLVNEIEIENNVLQKWQQEIDQRAKKSGQNVAANRTAKSAASTKKFEPVTVFAAPKNVIFINPPLNLKVRTLLLNLIK